MTLIRDWLRNLARNADPFVMQPGRINRVSWAQALQKAEEWHDAMQAGESDIEEQPEHKELFLDLKEAGQWWKLTGSSCLNREGEVMGHCVADYVDEVESGNAIILSLRDKKNNPHVTVEASFGENEAADWEIKQVKGKGNEAPVAKYWPQVEALLNHLWHNTNSTNVTADQEGEYDLGQMGIIPTPNPKAPFIRVKAHGEASNNPEEWGVEVHGSEVETGDESSWDLTVQEASNQFYVNTQEIISKLAIEGELRVEDIAHDVVLYPMYPWSHEVVVGEK